MPTTQKPLSAIKALSMIDKADATPKTKNTPTGAMADRGVLFVNQRPACSNITTSAGESQQLRHSERGRN
jgi:hypothetical protein